MNQMCMNKTWLSIFPHHYIIYGIYGDNGFDLAFQEVQYKPKPKPWVKTHLPHVILVAAVECRAL